MVSAKGHSEMKPTVTVAIIHAPGQSGAHIRELWASLLAGAGHRGITLDEAHVNPAPQELAKSRSKCEPTQLIIAWGLPATPDWEGLVRQYCLHAQIVNLIVVNQEDLDGAFNPSHSHPFSSAIGHGVAAQKRNRMDNFMAGFFNGQPPYGYRKARLPGSRALPTNGECAKGPYRLALGDPDEISVVHYIFDAFASEGLTRTQILQALITQGIQPPVDTRRWTPQKVTAILADPVYIGSNRHTGYYRDDVFPALVSKEQFYRAQAILTTNSAPTSEFLRLHTAQTPPHEEHSQG